MDLIITFGRLDYLCKWLELKKEELVQHKTQPPFTFAHTKDVLIMEGNSRKRATGLTMSESQFDLDWKKAESVHKKYEKVWKKDNGIYHDKFVIKEYFGGN